MRLDTIVAPITGSQSAAVAIVRLSGPQAWEIGARIFSPWPKKAVSHHAFYGKLRTGDVGLALPFAEGHSYAGEESLEFSIHGSPASIAALVDVCVREGARIAEPGEFTRRAFMNGRMDLSQAEGVRDTVMAQTELQLKQANLHREGALRREVADLREKLSNELVAVEASVDFSEEIGDYDRMRGRKEIQCALNLLLDLLGTAAAGKVLREGLRIAIVGRPNAGKSSLLNLLLGVDRAIVTPIAGTTRDYIEEQAELCGVLCLLSDTAGLRPVDDEVEAMGVRRAKLIASNADEFWYVYDSSSGWSEEDENWVSYFGGKRVILANKVDLPQAASQAPEAISISAITRAGIGSLMEHVSKNLAGAGERPFINTRHSATLSLALHGVETALDALENDLPDDLVSVGLREAIERLGEVTGDTATDDIIDRIFHGFCVGK